ncbi:unnamed protein product, partial [Arabidopsis halleri]
GEVGISLHTFRIRPRPRLSPSSVTQWCSDILQDATFSSYVYRNARLYFSFSPPFIAFSRFLSCIALAVIPGVSILIQSVHECTIVFLFLSRLLSCCSCIALAVIPGVSFLKFVQNGGLASTNTLESNLHCCMWLLFKR